LLDAASMRRHHEEIVMLPALVVLLPLAGALWLRIKTGRETPSNRT